MKKHVEVLGPRVMATCSPHASSGGKENEAAPKTYSGASGSERVPRSDRGDAGTSDLGVLERFHARDADRAEKFAVDDDHLATFNALHRQIQPGVASVVDHVFQRLARTPGMYAGACLFRGDGDAHQGGVVQSLQADQMAAMVTHSDDDVPSITHGFCFRRLFDFAGVIKRQNGACFHGSLRGGCQERRIALKSFTLVSVGPLMTESSSFSKKPWPSLSASASRGRMPAAQARFKVSGVMMAPAISSRPSTPSVSPASDHTSCWPSSSIARESRNSTLRPPRPSPRTVTVVSPPESSTHGRGKGSLRVAT